MLCPTENATAIDQSGFWDPGTGIVWDHHRIGWAIAGGCAVLTVIITIVSVLQHCRNYTVPREQRQVIRILYMPPVYAVISFFSYRYFKSYTYYSLIYVAYEAVTISAFLLLIIEYVAATAAGHNAANALERKDKRPLPMPFCCWRYRPTKAYFMYTVKWSVLQYVIVRPLVSIVGIVCQRLGVLCETEGHNPHFASVYLSAADFVSITIALYGLLVFFGLMKDELEGRRPLAKFLCIKLIVMFTFYQGFVFTMLEGRVIHATLYWTETNIANGLNALTICIEMVFFALAMWWAYPASEYRHPGERHTGIWRPLWDSINYMDFVAEIWGSLRYFVGAATHHERVKPGFGNGFGAGERGKLDDGPEGEGEGDTIRLAPYAFTAPGAQGGGYARASPDSPKYQYPALREEGYAYASPSSPTHRDRSPSPPGEAFRREHLP
ncbi:organic solute transporter Ostalpha-domain-containing protein [Mycena belliarum]|uniref:Organic solute transporter Ostalpha-domain-containing protein n=1 Tax=Mycena belliarum TaxID=1033014 RepID=A0AAD6XYF6_9AGAR|nr:organic solute transporter Ostalpha-domain-containing protein [Mycena belliae]